MNAGAVGAKRAVFGSILEQRMKVHKDCWNVATFQRPHVVTPQRRDVGSTKLKVNKWKRHDAPTSRRLNIATLQRLDVNASFVLSSLKAKRGCRIGGIGDRTNSGTEIRAAVTLILTKSL